MSTLAYAAFTTSREKAKRGTSTTESPPGVSTVMDSLAALVPAETLTLHAVILSVTTKTVMSTTEITEPATLSWSFWGLLVLSAMIYVAYRLIARKWDKFDYLRMVIPALAFVGWTMLQRATAFDAVFPGMTEAPRTVIALFLGVLLGVAAAALGYQADQKEPPGDDRKRNRTRSKK